MIVREALRRSEERLSEAGCDTPAVDAEILVAHVLGTTRSSLRADRQASLSPAQLAELDKALARRERREPLAYVLGEWGFRRLTLAVDSRALVPRPETEIVVERCLALVEGVEAPHVLDVGTGSGAIALAVADEHPGARVTGLDVSEDALALARENVRRTGLAVELVRADLYDGLPAGPWDLVVSNPPYVAADEIEALAPEVRDWEPRQALVGEGATEAVARAARGVLRSGGALVLETADGDAGRVAALLCDLGYEGVTTTRDLAGRDRVVQGRVSNAAEAVAAIRAGKLVVLPTDTVYGLACAPDREESVRALSELKERSPDQPVALVAASVDALLEAVPELGDRDALLRALLPGPLTLVLPNPAGRFPWLAGGSAGTIGVRVPTLVGAAKEVLDEVGAVAATSANRHGGDDPRRVKDVPDEIREAMAVVVDGGELPGTPSTVVDVTTDMPRVLREGAVPRDEALARVAAVLAE